MALAWRGGRAPAERSATPLAAAPAPRAEKPAPVRVHLRVASVPSGANVFRSADGQLVGATPLQLDPLRESGQVALRIERDGYQSAQANLSLAKDGELSVKLLPVKPRPRLTPSAAPKKQLGDDAMDPYAQ
ncbi:MAG TPA: PEGA domain-containing protein [Myxococcaceae bacterium]|nr:PEGA domain-containing protein [Myxococcaceae bacterium]